MSRTVLLSLAFVLGSWFSLRTKFQYLVLSLASRLVSLLISLGLDVQKWSLLHHWSRRKALETFFLFFFGIMATRLLPTFQSRCLIEHSNSGKKVSIRFDSRYRIDFFRFDSIRQSDKFAAYTLIFR